MLPRVRRRSALLGLAAGLLWTVPAGAFTPPAIYVRLAHANSIDHTAQSDWIALSTAPHLKWIGGYEIGYAFEDAPGPTHVQHAALQVTGVPDGQPTQPRNQPYCLGGPGTVGTIVPVSAEAVQFEGVGTYTVTVSVGPPSGGPKDCMVPGPATASATGSFTVDMPVTLAVVGHPLAFRAKSIGSAFAGVRTAATPGGDPETRCARKATVKADGSITGALQAPDPKVGGVVAQVPEIDLTRPGAWTCVARGTSDGTTDSFVDRLFYTPWSAPLRFDVRSDFRSARSLTKPAAKHPVLTFTPEFPDAAPGGTGTLKLRRLVRCRGAQTVYKPAGTYKGRFDAKGRARLSIRRPSAGFFTGAFSFSGTRFYTRSVDPNPVLLGLETGNPLTFISPLAFPQCPGFS
jgi:hypothetical protein